MRRLAIAALSVMAAAGGAMVALAGAAHAQAPVVDTIRFGADDARTRIVVESDHPLEFFTFTLAEQSARVVIDLEHVDFQLGGRAIGASQRQGGGAGLVAAYRYAQFSPERSRIVLDLAEPARVWREFNLPPAPGADKHRLVVDLKPADARSFRASAGYPEDRVPVFAHARERVADRELVVVLDPGHGGRMPGAISAGGLQEKDVNLAIARAVRDRLEATGRYRVVMTRSDDRDVDLHDRVRISREAGADLFLSIHADAADHGSVRGASVYTLADYAEARSRTEILEEDPWILDLDLAQRRAEVEDILIDLVHRDTKNQSTAFAEALIPHLRYAGPLLRNTHRSAGYYVLLAPDVPAVLLEAGFLTDCADAARLASAARRGRVADAVVAGINSYFDQRERLYAAR